MGLVSNKSFRGDTDQGPIFVVLQVYPRWSDLNWDRRSALGVYLLGSIASITLTSRSLRQPKPIFPARIHTVATPWPRQLDEHHDVGGVPAPVGHRVAQTYTYDHFINYLDGH